MMLHAMSWNPLFLVRLVAAGVFAFAGTPLLAGTIEVALAPFSPQARTIQAGSSSREVVMTVRLSGKSGVVAVQGLRLNAQGTADWGQDLDSADGVVLALDNGDSEYDPGDYTLWQGPGVGGEMTCAFSTPVLVPAGAQFDVWVVVHRTAQAGTLLGDSFVASVDNPDDVLVDPADVVQFGVAALTSAPLSVAEFHVSRVYPLKGLYEELTVVGFGFSEPVSMTVGGNPCGGAAVVNIEGTRITGLRAIGFHLYRRSPNQEIRISSGAVVDHVLPFTYTNFAHDVPGACSATSQSGSSLVWPPIACALAIAALGATRRKLRHAR